MRNVDELSKNGFTRSTLKETQRRDMALQAHKRAQDRAAAVGAASVAAFALTLMCVFVVIVLAAWYTDYELAARWSYVTLGMLLLSVVLFVLANILEP